MTDSGPDFSVICHGDLCWANILFRNDMSLKCSILFLALKLFHLMETQFFESSYVCVDIVTQGSQERWNLSTFSQRGWVLLWQISSPSHLPPSRQLWGGNMLNRCWRWEEILRVEWEIKSLNCLALKSISLCITWPVLLGQWLFLVYVSFLVKKTHFFVRLG